MAVERIRGALTDEARLLRVRTRALRVWTLIGVLGLVYFVWQMLEEPIGIIVPPLLLAAVIVYVLNPVVTRLHNRGIPRLVSTGVAYLSLIAAVVVAIVFLGPVLAKQIGQFIGDAPEILANLQRGVNRWLSSIGIDYRLPTLDPESAAFQERIREYISGAEGRERLAGILAGAGSVAGAIIHTVIVIVLGPVLAFYVLADLPHITEGLKRLIPPGQREEIQVVAEKIGDKVGAYFRGQLLVALFVGVATSIGLLIVGLPFWALVGALTGLFNIVPLIGPFVGGAIGVTVALTGTGGPKQAAFVVLVMVVVQQVDNHWVTPNIMSRTVQIHPITVMLGLLVAGTMFGILGMLVAMPVIAASKLVTLHLLATRAPWASPDLPIPETVEDAMGARDDPDGVPEIDDPQDRREYLDGTEER